MKFVTTLTLFSMLFFNITKSTGQENTYGKISYEKAINLSGKQRMLSQKIAKVVILKQSGADTPTLKQEYKTSIIIFERSLKVLDDNGSSQSSKVRAMIRAENQEWNKFKAVISNPIKDISLLLKSSESLLLKCNNLVSAIEEDSKFNKELNYSSPINQLKVKTINLSGKQRMLSQKMCLYYASCRFLRKGKNADIACSKYQNIYSEINNAVNELLVNELNTGEIDSVIATILGLVENIQSRKKDFRENRIPLGEMIKITDNLLNLFNKATSLYSL